MSHRFKEGLALHDLEGYAVGARRIGHIWSGWAAVFTRRPGGAEVENEHFHAVDSIP
jgi:hypothetical protein